MAASYCFESQVWWKQIISYINMKEENEGNDLFDDSTVIKKISMKPRLNHTLTHCFYYLGIRGWRLSATRPDA